MVLNPKLLENRADDLGALAEVVPGDTREEVVFNLPLEASMVPIELRGGEPVEGTNRLALNPFGLHSR